MDKKITQEISWTADQQSIFDSKNENLLVSASAGSGKTTVMIEKIVRLMLDNNFPVPISNFLVLTFTKASAADMKVKLLKKLWEQPLTDFCLEQIDQVEVSDISTIDVFCSKLVRSHFYEIGIDPNFKIIDETEVELIKEKALTKLFKQKEREADESFFTLFEIFQKKRSDEGLKNVIIRFYNFLKSMEDGDVWFNKTLDECYELNLDQNKAALNLNFYISKQIEEISKNCEKLAKKCLKFNENALFDYFTVLSTNLRSVNLKNNYIVNSKNIFELKFDRIPKLSSPNDELKSECDEFLKFVKSEIENLKVNLIGFDEQKLKSDLAKAKKHLTMLYDLVKEFEKIYSESKRESGVLDFSDLELFAIQILNNDAIRKAVQEKYKYVFVDEYQDINEVQEKILSLVSSRNNRFMVGDIKQSIYQFRLCDPDIFLSYLKRFNDGNGGKLINLNANFRSDKKILKFVDKVFSGVMTEWFGGIDYEKTSCFTAGEKNLDNPNSLNLIYIDSKREKTEKETVQGVYSVKNHVQIEDEETANIIAEANLVAQKITSICYPDGPGKASEEFKNFAILVNSVKGAEISKFIEVLSEYKIPVSSLEEYNLLEQKNIQEILDFVKFAVNQNDDILTFKVLKGRLFGFTNNELSELRKINYKTNFYNCVREVDSISNEKLKLKVQNFLSVTQKFAAFSKILSIKEFIERVVDEFNLIELSLLDEDGERKSQDIKKLLSVLPDVLAVEFVVDYQKIALNVNKDSSPNAVNLMTIHSSKGLEFKYVFLVKLNKKINTDSSRTNLAFNKNVGVGLDTFDLDERVYTQNIASSAVKLTLTRKIVEEQQRVLYVALTRAIEKLFVVCTKPSDKLLKEFPNRPNSYLNWFEWIISDEISGKHDENINFEKYSIDDFDFERNFEKPQLLLSESESNEKPFEYKFKSATIVPLKTSASKIISAELDGHTDYENFALGDENSFAERGTAYHKVFEKINFFEPISLNKIEKIKTEVLSEDLQKLVTAEKVLRALNLPFFSEIKQGDLILKEREFYAKIPATMIGSGVSDEFILQGVIDFVLITENEVVVLDYKTGKITDEKIKKYSRQLELYSFALEKALGRRVTKRLLCFVDETKIIEI
ncbi:MAG: UvrD-helicase domain-containing protein [Clostridia bacterium]|nr:UvrD-helicase domain-containing protein [Clostridia bacterium]